MLRSATAGDITRVGELAESGDLFPSDIVGDMIAPFLTGGSEELWLVAETDHRVVGFLYAAPEKLTEGTYNLLAMAVAPACRTAGIGSALVAEAETRLVGRNGRILLVETSSQPHFAPTIAFYRARGFKEEARIRDYWSDGDDKLIFRKPIT